MFDGWLSSFCRTFGATDSTIFPGVEFADESLLHQILQKKSAHKVTKILHDKGLLLPEIGYFSPSEVGGLKAGPLGGLKSHATDDGMEHLKKNNEYSMPTKKRGQLGALKSHATDDGMEDGEHLMKNNEYSMSTKKRSQLGGESKLGCSTIKDLFLSIVEIGDAGTSTPMLATSISTMATYLTSLGAYSTYNVARNVVNRNLYAINNQADNSPESTKSDVSWKFKATTTKRKFVMTKHLERPLNIENIHVEEIKEHSLAYRQQEKEKRAKKRSMAIVH
jgi:hypothetical protein